jgi:hypothetical protein
VSGDNVIRQEIPRHPDNELRRIATIAYNLGSAGAPPEAIEDVLGMVVEDRSRVRREDLPMVLGTLVTAESQEKILPHEAIWQQRSGIRNSVQAIRNLPESLRVRGIRRRSR